MVGVNQPTNTISLLPKQMEILGYESDNALENLTTNEYLK
jgi:hypothetical protein